MNMDLLITYALLNNDHVINAVAKTREGIPLINVNRSPSGVYPMIEYHQIGGGDVNFADMEVFIERNTFQLTFFCKAEEYMDVRDELLRTLRNISFKVMHEYTFKDMTTDITNYVVHIRSFIERVYFDTMMAEQTELYNQRYGNDTPIPDGTYFDEVENTDYKYIDDLVKDELPVYDDTEGLEFLN